MSRRIVNPNLTFLHKCWKEGKTGALLEGSSRSGKTWSSVDFLVYLCANHSDLVINLLKETYNSFKTTLYNDFNERLPMFDIQSPFADRQDVHQFNLFGNKINLIGADKTAGDKKGAKFHGVGSHFSYYNEMLDVPQQVFDQVEQRCKVFWWGDYNPKFSSHWVYDKVGRRADVGFLKTTFLDNPFISKPERRKILSYEPTHPDDRHLPMDARRPHPTNITEGTADDYMWNVYGLGLRSAPEGLIFQHVTWITEFPNTVDKIFYGLDFGFTTSPSALVKLGVSYGEKKLYLKKLLYTPTESSQVLIPMLREIGKTEDFKSHYIWADSASEGMISDLQRAGFKVFAVKKMSVMYGVGVLKNFKIHIVDDVDFRKEQENYKIRTINGISIDEPIDDWNHLWDASRYAGVGNLRVTK